MADEQFRKEREALPGPGQGGAGPPQPAAPGTARPTGSAGSRGPAQRQRRPPAARPRIELCPTVVACREAPHGWRAVWRHQLRWARTIRHCQPLPYAFSLLSNPTWWPLVWFAATPGAEAWVGFGLCLVSRLAMAAHCQWRLTRSWRHLPWLWLAPVKDLLQVALWLLAFGGRTVVWRGERYRVCRGGELRWWPSEADAAEADRVVQGTRDR